MQIGLTPSEFVLSELTSWRDEQLVINDLSAISSLTEVAYDVETKFGLAKKKEERRTVIGFDIESRPITVTLSIPSSDKKVQTTVEWSSVGGQLVATAKNQALTGIFSFGKEGRIDSSKLTYEGGRGADSTRYKYDQEGHLVEQVSESPIGNMSERIAMEYGPTGRLLSFRRYGQIGRLTDSRDYDAYGRETLSVRLEHHFTTTIIPTTVVMNRTESQYPDELSRIVKYQSRNNEREEFSSSTWVDYVNTKDGFESDSWTSNKVTRSVSKMPNGKSRETRYKRDAVGREVDRTVFIDGKVTCHSVSDYSPTGILVQEVDRTVGVSNGYCIGMGFLSSRGHDLEIDAHGNWTSKDYYVVNKEGEKQFTSARSRLIQYRN